MVIVGIQYAKGISKKSGQPYESYILHCISKSFRMSDGWETVTYWISPAEYSRTSPRIGEQVVVGRDGSVYKMPDHPIDFACLCDLG